MLKTFAQAAADYCAAAEKRTAQSLSRLLLLGALAGVSRQTISQIERGDYSPSVTLALKIARICQCRVEDIFIYEEEETHE